MLSLLYAVPACSQAERTAQTATPAQATHSATPATVCADTNVYTNSIGMEFISIPAGSFMMGTGDSDRNAYQSEKPQHKVNLSKPFSIGKYEVTQAQREATMGSNPYTLDRSNPYGMGAGLLQRQLLRTKPGY